MSYKIVQTVEGGVANLSVVPDKWESKGILWWPPKNTKYPLKLIKDKNSRPGLGWATLKCTLKRQNLRTYDEATNELTSMEQYTDTDDQENECCIMETNRTEPTNEINFNEMAENLTYSQPGAYEISMKNLEPVQEETIQVMEQQETVQILSSENFDIMISNQTQILNQLNLIIDHQKRFGQKLASLSVQLDETNEKIRELQEKKQCNVKLLKDASSEERESFSLKPIETNEEFEMFELTLADKTQRNKIIKFLSTLYASKPGEGQTCAYKLIDVLFTKEFLCHCSWSGGSRGEQSKIPMKNFKNFRKFFFEVIHMWDSSFTDDKMLNFFKMVLRNATKRKSMQSLRESTKRVRKSKKSKGEGDNEATVPEGNKDNDSDYLEANKSNNMEELSTDNELC